MDISYDFVKEAVIKQAIRNDELLVDEGEVCIKRDNRLFSIDSIAVSIYQKLGGNPDLLPDNCYQFYKN